MLEKHPIVFKSSGGLDFELNYIYLNSEDHRGDLGPHLYHETDTLYKKGMEANLRAILPRQHYQIEEVILILGLIPKQAEKAFKKLPRYTAGYNKEDIVKRLMGGSFYSWKTNIVL